jgi:hypothetical protein
MKGEIAMNTKTMSAWMAAVAMVVTAGCSHYYKVNDPAGNKEYYTKDIDSSRSGAIKIKDEKTGAHVTLQSSEVKEISEEEFNAALKGEKPKQGEAPKQEEKAKQ